MNKRAFYNTIENMRTADLHIHSNYSDGSENIKELVETVKKAGLNIFALTDHDTTAGCLEAEQITPKEIKFIKGVELTCICPNGNIKCHILGYNCDVNNEKLINLIKKGKTLRRIKLETRIKYLKDVWNIELTKEELDWLYSRESVVKTHFANILVKRTLSTDNVSAMKKYLDACKTPNTKFDAEEAIDAIVSSGAIPVWAHPLGGEGERHISPEEFLPQLQIMKSIGIKGLECHYSRYNEKEKDFLVQCAKENDLLISGGSDYHGKNKENIPIGKLNIDNTPIDAKELTILQKL